MYKKFLSAIVLVFAFLFLNVSLNSFNIDAEEMPSEVYNNAGWGEKAGYWAIINYGADYIGSKEIVIDIQKEAIANEEVKFIVVTENEHSSEELVYYERNVSPGFSSRINYTLKNTSYGKKYIAVLLLRELSKDPNDNLIVDKIIIEVDQKRNISELTAEDILLIPDVDPVTQSLEPYDVSVMLNPDTILGEIDDYVFKNVKYKLLNKENNPYLNAFEDEGINTYYFTVYRNGVYQVEVEDIFGYTITKTIEIRNLKDPDIIIEVYPSVITPINREYSVGVEVLFYETNYVLNSDELELLDVIYNGEIYSIKENMQFIVRENGIYTIKAETTNGSRAEVVLQINNIDKENPYVQVLNTILVYTDNLDSFLPENEIFVYDNVTPGEKIRVEMTYHTVTFVEGSPVISSYYTNSKEVAKEYLYTVRDLFIRYIVSDEAGNTVEKESYIHSIDTTKPSIDYTEGRMFLYINDPYPTEEELEEAYGIIVTDNSLYPGSEKEISYYMDFSQLPVDEFNRLNKLGEYRIFLSAIDEAGNMSDSIVLIAEVRKRLITIEAGKIDEDGNLIEQSIYSVYGDDIGDISDYMGYHCVTRDGGLVPCSSELLEGDSISGELFVLNAYYTGTYDIHYENISIPSDLYYLDYGDINTFTIKPRTLKVVAHHKEKDYLDEDPELTYEILDVCSVRPEEDDIYIDYRCNLLDGDNFIGSLERYIGDPPLGVEVFYDPDSYSISEAVWFDSEGNVLPRTISQGTLSVLELYNGGVDNYVIDFVESELMIWPKEVHAYIQQKEKIYGEADPVYTLRECRGKEPINSMSPEDCMIETKITLERKVTGEKVYSDSDGNYIDYYEIGGAGVNMNYNVIFYNSYLTILRRQVYLSVVGDLDNNGNPTGKYTIYYEQEMPVVEIYDSSNGISTGLVHNLNLTEPIADKLKYGEAAFYTNCNGTCEESLLTEYVSGIGLYIIRKGSIEIVDMNDENAEKNYDITFNDGILEVIKKKIWIKILKDLSKVYGDNDAYFTEEDLEGYSDYVILEANGRYIIEITPTTLPGEDPYIPRDNEKMKYHLNREEGIYVDSYDIFIEYLEGCENYEVNLFEDYKYTITQRNINFVIFDQSVIYKDIPNTFTYDEELAKFSLQYEDTIVGNPEVEPYVHVGEYKIGIGTLRIIDKEEFDVSFNYRFNVEEGILTVNQREITIAVRENQSKQYGNNDPIIEFDIFHKGVLEALPKDQYEGRLAREGGEVPGYYYTVHNNETDRDEFDEEDFPLRIHNFGTASEKIEDYLIIGWDFTNKFYIEKRTITVKARDVSEYYGNDYSMGVVYDAYGSKLAYNLTLKIDGQPIHDRFEGDLKILGEVDGVGQYVISCEDIRIVRHYTGEDVTDTYYNFTFENGLLTIKPRSIKIKPHDGQYKLYGDSDVGITFDYYSDDGGPALLDEDDEFVGSLQRKVRIVNDEEVSEDVGTYIIELGTLNVKTASGKPNYQLTIDGEHTFTINPRTLNVIANDLTIYYGDPYELTYRIEGDGLANNPSLGIVDTISGELNLEREYSGYGIYRILGENLSVSNIRNYNYTFSPGLLVVNKKLINITPKDETLSKIYGEEDPESFKFTLDVVVPYTGKLTREEGNDVGKYRILIGTLDFGPNYEIALKESYFTISPKVITVVPIPDQYKIYGEKDPVLKYDHGELIGEDKFFGSLSRKSGEEVGEYEILQGSLSLSKNYEIRFMSGIFRIKYAEFSEINIYSLTNNQYQVKGEEEIVQLYARFNAGADESNIKDVEWKVTKVLGNGDESAWEFTKDSNNIVSFLPSGSVGTYKVTASYNGVEGLYEVYVQISTVGNVYIRWVDGPTEQILGDEKNVRYMVIVPDNASSDATVQWIVNDNAVKVNSVSNIYFDYVPNLGKGKYLIQAKIGNRISDPLEIIVNNNNPPLITLIGDPVVYVEALSGEYIEQGATVLDDMDGDITSSLKISGYVDNTKKGTYYIRYDATDSHGNNAITVYRQVVVRDTTPPVVTLTKDADGEHREIVLLYGQPYKEYGATAIDNYDGVVEVQINNPIKYDKIGTYEVTYIAKDKSGNTGTATRTVTIVDNVSPIISLLGEEIMYVEVYTEFNDPGAWVEDNVDGNFAIEGTSFFFGETQVDKIDTSILGTYYVRYDYKDSGGNIGAGKVRTVHVRDSTPPEIILKGTNPHIIRYTYPTIEYNEPGAIVVDNYDTYVPYTVTGELGNELGTYYLYYNAVDSNGNIAKTVTRQVVVVDVENPIIHFFDACPQYITIEAMYEKYDTRCDAPGYGLWVEDDYMEDLEELQKRVVVRGSVDNYTVGTYIISYDVTDKGGNSAVTLNRYVKVVDTTAPVITLIGGGENGTQTVEVFEPYQELGANVKDLYDEYHGLEIKLVINHNIVVNKLGDYIVTYNATDSNGNKAEPVIRIVKVRDTTPPEVTLIGENPIIIERGMDYIEYGATAIDNYDGPITQILILDAPTGKRKGSFKVIYRAVDSSGNVGEAIRDVIVQDTIPPIVLGVEDGAYYKEPVSIYFIPTIGTDEVLEGWLNNQPITSPWYVADEGIYDLLVMDDAGNKTEIRFYIDTTPPEILGVKNGEYTNREEVKVYSNEPIKYYEYRYQSGDWVRTSDQEINFKEEGIYRVFAVDMADNVSSIVMFTIDRTPPVYFLTGVANKGITNTDVHLNVEDGASVVVNSNYNIPTLYTFSGDGYYHVTIRDAAANTVVLQFVINKTKKVTVNNKIIEIISQHDANNKMSITGTTYPRNSGYMLVKPLVEGGFEYVSGKLFSETEYQKLIAGETIEFNISPTDDTYMYAGFVVSSEELNKFGMQTVDGDKDDDGSLLYIALVLLLFLLIGFFFLFFLKRRRKEEDEEENEETIIDEY